MVTTTTSIVLVIFLSFTMVHSQLIGSRGVIKLKPGYEYRDKYTVAASEQVAEFAKKFQPFADNDAARRKSRRLSVV